MALPTRWTPVRTTGLLDPFHDLEDVFRSLGSRAMTRGYDRTLEMHMDISEDDTAYRVTIDVPGVHKEDIDVAVEGKQVSITAEIKREQSSNGDKEMLRERFEGKAYRTFSLPVEVDSGAAQARYDGGVLRLTLPKKGDSTSRHLAIN